MSEGSSGPLPARGMGDDAADTVVGSGPAAPASMRDDGQPVGAADRAADRLNSGADAEDDTDDDVLERNTYDPLDDEAAPATEGGQAVGAADRDADVDRSR